MKCIKNATIITVTKENFFKGDVLIKDKKIFKIGENLSSEADEIIDATNLYLFPGLVEAHCHLGLSGHAVRYEGEDYNELNSSITPHLDAIDGFNPQDETIKEAALHGVTTAATGPGSSNIFGGKFIVVKTQGNCVDDMIVKRNAAMKCAFGENPKFCYKTKDIPQECL